MENQNESIVEDDIEESPGSSTLRKFRYTQVFAGVNWIPARMGELVWRAESGSDIIFLSQTNDSNVTMRLIKSYTHRMGIRASLRQCRVFYEDDQGVDIVRKGVIAHIDEHPVAEDYKRRMDIATLHAKRQSQVAELYRLMGEVGLSPDTYDFNQPFVDKDGIERYPQDFILIDEDMPSTSNDSGQLDLPNIADLIPQKRARGRPKKVEGVESSPRVKKTPNPFPSAADTAPKRGPGRPKKEKSAA